MTDVQADPLFSFYEGDYADVLLLIRPPTIRKALHSDEIAYRPYGTWRVYNGGFFYRYFVPTGLETLVTY